MSTITAEETTAERNDSMLEKIGNYWNDHIHDLELAKHPVGSKGFFADLDEYRFDKLHYLAKVVDFKGYAGKKVLEVGCGVGIDLIRFAKGGAQVTGVDLAKTSIDLANKYFAHHNVQGNLQIGNGEDLEFEDDTFDMVYAHGVIQYTANAEKMVDELLRVVKPNGQAIMMVYNRNGWLNFMSEKLGVALEHEDAPVLKKYSIEEYRELLAGFTQLRILPERFPVASRLQTGMKALFFNWFFVPLFNMIPKAITRKTGWHLMAFATK